MRKYLTKEEAEAKGLFSKTALKEKRLKPAGAVVDQYWQGQGFVSVYDINNTIQMRPYRAPTEKQKAALAAGRELIGTVPCIDCGTRISHYETPRCVTCDEVVEAAEIASHRKTAIKSAQRWLEKDFVIIDTETTDLNGVVLEIAIIDKHGNSLLNTLINPETDISPEAFEVHGIAEDMVKDSPTWSDIHDEFVRITEGRLKLYYNADFDTGIIQRSARKSRFRDEFTEDLAAFYDYMTGNKACVMQAYAEFYGDYDGRKFIWQKLSYAAEQFNYQEPQTHRALDDCLMTLAVLKGMAESAN